MNCGIERLLFKHTMSDCMYECGITGCWSSCDCECTYCMLESPKIDKNYLSEMPDEILFNILRFNDVSGLIMMSMVSKKFLELSRDRFLWKTYFSHETILLNIHYDYEHVQRMLNWYIINLGSPKIRIRSYHVRFTKIICSGKIYVGQSENSFGCKYIKNCAIGGWTVENFKDKNGFRVLIKAYCDNYKDYVLNEGRWFKQKERIGIFNCRYDIESGLYFPHYWDENKLYVRNRLFGLLFDVYCQVSEDGKVIGIAVEILKNFLKYEDKYANSSVQWDEYKKDEPIFDDSC